MKPKPPVSKARWASWYFFIGVALTIFYGILTPFWFAIRALAWIAEFRSRRRKPAA